MNAFTLEIAGRAVACISARDRSRAEEAINNPWFRDGLLGLERDGPPIWNGEDEWNLRASVPEELDILLGSQRSRGSTREDRDAVAFLVSGQLTSEPNHRLILASRVEHTPVYNEPGERIGHIEDLSIDRRDGHVVYAIMSFGGFLGIGKRFHPLPWHILNYDIERGGYVVPLDEAELKLAPHYEPEELKQLGGPSHEVYKRRILEYYGRYGPPMI